MEKTIFIVIIILLIPLFLIGCKKTVKEPIVEEGQLEQVKEMTELKIETLSVGTGDREVKSGDKIKVDYVGTLVNGTKFDSSIDRGEPFIFTIGVGHVIQGWDQGLMGMKVGEKRKLTIPSNLAYGERGAGSSIPPNSILIFEVKLISFSE